MSGHKHYTLILVSDDSPRTHKFRIPGWLLPRSAIALGILVVGAIIASVHYFNVVGEVTENQILRDENVQLRSDLKRVRERIAQIGTTLDRVERFDQKLRAVTIQKGGESAAEALDPVGPSDGDAEESDQDDPSTLAMLDTRAMSNRLDDLMTVAAHQEASLVELQAYFEDQRSLLSTTPSLWPTRGWVTSDFGYRVDPFTAARKGHEGLDIAGPVGSAVVAPSDATVVYAGPSNGYGNVIVLDHGFGIKTRYGHLSAIGVEMGQKVKRGERIGSLGSTGHSTGPHLHYEVRVNGVPQNPRKFILE